MAALVPLPAPMINGADRLWRGESLRRMNLPPDATAEQYFTAREKRPAEMIGGSAMEAR
jgi:hypothetical protein